MKTLVTSLALVAAAASASAGSKSPAPAEVAKRFYEMASQGRCAETQPLFSAEALRAVAARTGSPEAFRRFCEAKAGSSPLAKISVLKEEKRGARAQVLLERSYVNGASAVESEDLVKVDGAWKLSLGMAPEAAKGGSR
jgi:hypothetical protein